MTRLVAVSMLAWLRGSRALVVNAPSALGKKSTAADVIATLKPDLSGKVAIVTGGNSGIGVETVKALASAKYKVILACRNVAAGKAAREDMYTRYDIDVEELDLNDLASVKAFADRVATVDLLVLNAGIMALNKKELTVDGFEKQIGVNHFGPSCPAKLGCHSDAAMREMADAMVSSGLKDAGYELINLSEGWPMGPNQRFPNGTIRWDPERYPFGIQALADYIHSKVRAALISVVPRARRIFS